MTTNGDGWAPDGFLSISFTVARKEEGEKAIGITQEEVVDPVDLRVRQLATI